MARIDDLPLWIRATLKVYPWRRIDPIPCAPLRQPIAKSRVALVTTAGLVPPGDRPFDESIKGGDYSYRVVAAYTNVQELGHLHQTQSFTHPATPKDRNTPPPRQSL